MAWVGTVSSNNKIVVVWKSELPNVDTKRARLIDAVHNAVVIENVTFMDWNAMTLSHQAGRV